MSLNIFWLSTMHFAALMLWVTSVEAIEYRYVRTSIEQIIGEQPVKALHFDSQGTTWVGTPSGLFHIDETSGLSMGLEGVALIRHSSADTVAIFKNQQNRTVSVSADGRMASVSDTSLQPEPVGRFDRQPTIAVLAVEDEGRKLVHANRAGEAFSYIGPLTHGRLSSARIQLDSAFSTKFVYTDDLGFCAGFTSQVYCQLTDQEPLYMSAFENIESQIVGIAYLAKDKALLAITRQGKAHIASISGVGLKTVVDLPTLSGVDVRNIVAIDEKAFIATDTGLHLFDYEEKALSLIPTGRHANFTDFVADQNGLWALAETGLAYIAESRSQSWSPAEGPAEVLSFEPDGANGFFIGSYDGILYRRINEQQHTELWPSENSESVDKRVTSLAFNQTEVFAGSFNDGFSIFSVDANRKTLTLTGRELPETGVTALKLFNGTLVIGTFQSGLKILHSGKINSVRLPTSWSSNPTPITSIASTNASNTLLITSENEVMVLCSEVKFHICAVQRVTSKRANPVILSSVVTGSNSVLLGTLNNGLLRTSLNEIAQGGPLRSATSLTENVQAVYSILPAKEDYYWLTTNDGLYLKSLKDTTVKRFGKLQGLVNTDFHHGAGTSLGNGIAVVGGPYGYNVVSVDELSRPQEAPKVWIKAVRLNGATVKSPIKRNSYSRVVLDPDNLGFSVSMSLNDFRDIKFNRYEYKLEGFDLEWRSAGETNTAVYSSIPKGRYTFRARGANPYGSWSNEEAQIPIIVNAPAWQNKWAITTYALAGLCVGFLLKRANEKRLTQAYRLNQAEEAASSFRRLEDDYYYQVETNERLLLVRKESSHEVINLMQTIIAAQFKCKDLVATTDIRRIADQLDILNVAQLLTTYIGASVLTNIRDVVQEIVAIESAKNTRASQSIILNEIDPTPLLGSHGNYIALFIQEGLRMALNDRNYDVHIEPIISIYLDPPDIDNYGRYQYKLVIEDSGLPPNRNFSLNERMPFTIHFAATNDGEVSQDFDRGNKLTISLKFPLNTSDVK